MIIDLDHLHHYMHAIRCSENKTRTLDAFYNGQIKSKVWLIENLRPYINDPVTIEIHGGWFGVLASLLFQNLSDIKSIISIDIDPDCKYIAEEINRIEFLQNRFYAITKDMLDYDIKSDIIINTSCEHLTQDAYEIWLDNIPYTSLIVLQGNNYMIDEHIRISTDLEEFCRQSKINQVIFSGELDLPLYKRFMIIGRR